VVKNKRRGKRMLEILTPPFLVQRNQELNPNFRKLTRMQSLGKYKHNLEKRLTVWQHVSSVFQALLSMMF
ncbi:hypothetical protein PIB30_113572, partial [Stylosanthes scabra]|nr:hypothetical protein [Stylosanthes scabra]